MHPGLSRASSVGLVEAFYLVVLQLQGGAANNWFSGSMMVASAMGAATLGLAGNNAIAT
jgi:hypothetical protein